MFEPGLEEPKGMSHADMWEKNPREEAAAAKALRQEYAWSVPGIERGQDGWNRVTVDEGRGN